MENFFIADSTIAAIASAYGESGIGIIRLSGNESLEIAQKIFCPGKKKICAKNRSDFSFKPRYLHYGYIIDPENGKLLDEVLCVYMKSPKSYTGEDCVEIQCHGGMFVLKEILSLCLRNGAEIAEKGEFTKRAFLNGRMDLTKAEAVMDLIKASSEKSFNSANLQLFGALYEKIKAIRTKLLDILVQITVEMDYPDEDIEENSYQNLQIQIKNLLLEISGLLENAQEGRIIREGLNIALVGKPNVGKSSLMNSLLKENRSIVTQIPGTTRDTIEEQAILRGISVKLTDTAGIHETGDLVESLGIERSKAAFDKADILLLVLDTSRNLDEEDIKLLSMAKGRKAIAVLNKQDLPAFFSTKDLEEYNLSKICCCSLVKNEGLTEILDAIENLAFGEDFKRKEDPILTNIRHIRLVKDAENSLNSALDMIIKKEALDFIEIDLRRAFDFLGEITGDTASDEIIQTVFSRFCLGK